MSLNVAAIIANELSVAEQRVNAAIGLLDEGASVPFIARYRKEVTDSLDDTQLRSIEERLSYLRELDARKGTILKSIEEQGKLTPELKKQITETINKSELEDLYLPYKPKRRTKAEKAREAGLQGLADAIMAAPDQDPSTFAADYHNEEKGISSDEDALAGARDIIMELFSEHAGVNSFCREAVWQRATLHSEVIKAKEEDAAKFKDYFDYSEALKTIPSHRALALFRGRAQSFLRIKLALEEADVEYCKDHLKTAFELADISDWLLQTIDWTWKIKLFTKLEVESFLKLKEEAETAAIEVFARNLSNLLMASPSGAKVTMGLDPGYRTGVKAVVVDQTGKLLVHSTIFPHAPQKHWDASLAKLSNLCQTHQVELISIGNGTASRETNLLVSELLKQPELKNVQKIMISEAGASVYSASALAAEEFPELDVTYRGAVSIARRLQDPLAELVKIDPKAIGVGQYQHDVNQVYLARKLDNVVEDCVNSVGVDVNMASAPLLARIAGLNSTLAQNIVKYRDANGPFADRQALLNVERMGAKTFEQAAGFLRIANGNNPLDASAVHPEAYPVVEKMLSTKQLASNDFIGHADVIDTVDPREYVDAQFGLPTIQDILSELKKPGRDPRGEFKMAAFKDGVETLDDLKPDMVLEGTVTNVTEFGAFVDIGVHQDGLVHKSELGHGYVQDPSKVVKVGDIIKVRVLDVDVKRKRISLSKRLEKKGSGGDNQSRRSEPARANTQARKGRARQKAAAPKMESALAQALGAALKG